MSQLQYESKNQQILCLKKQLGKCKEQGQYWHHKYTSLAKQHNQLLQCLKKKRFFEEDLANFANCQQTSFLKQNQRTTCQDSIQFIQDQGQQVQNLQKDLNLFSFNVKRDNFQWSLTLSEQQIKKAISQKTVNIQPIEILGPLSPNRSPRVKEQSDGQIDFFSIQQIQKHTSCEQVIGDQTNENSNGKTKNSNGQTKSKRGLDLIQGYFILQKIDKFSSNLKNYDLWIKSADEGIKQKQRNLLQIVYRYTFQQQPLTPMQDDPFDSRVNQIKYGTPYQDLIYSFDNFKIERNQEQECRFLRKSMRKKFIHCLIRPQIIHADGKTFQTEIMYGFVSPFPFKTFFQDLHRTLQQQIKFEILKSSKSIPEQVQVSKDKRIQIMSLLMKDTFQQSLKSSSNIQNYPIRLSIETKVSIVKLDVQSHQDLRKIERQNLSLLLKKYNLLKISKLIHYVLTQKQLMVVAVNRKNLNQIHQIIRFMIKPFFWVFPTVYQYSDHFEPFLSSPMPLIVGMVFDFQIKNHKQSKVLMENQLVTIFVQQTAPLKDAFSFFFTSKPKYFPIDLRQVEGYEKDILFLGKYLNKVDKKSRTNSAQRILKYMNRLRNLIESGKIESELTPFLIDFLDTQMVQYYKDVLMGSNRKINDGQKYGSELAMAK